jgi:DNA-binding CsgD family transcriptional regulator
MHEQARARKVRAVGTVKFHLTNIYRKLGVSNRSGAVRFALEHDLAA